MGFDASAAMAHKTELDRAADDITSLIHQLEKTRAEFMSGWRSVEVYDMEAAFDENIRRLERLRSELQETGQCILKNAEDIQREEEERRAREEAERRAREEAERRAREQAQQQRQERELAERRAAEEAARQALLASYKVTPEELLADTFCLDNANKTIGRMQKR